jgi:TrmH family RNA methyltransferase
MLIKSQVKYIQSLSQKKLRDEEGVFVAEGPKIINELLRSATVKPRALYAVPEWIQVHNDVLSTMHANAVNEVSVSELERISFLSTPNQVLGIFSRPVFAAAADPAKSIVLMLDTIQDPGNMGTLLRTADWFGIEQVVCSEDSADAFNPKVVQSTMGSISRVQVEYTDLDRYLQKHAHVPVYAATLDGTPVHELKKIKNGILLIGNESKGIRASLLQKTTHRITIPGRGGAESLNAAVAAGILMNVLSGYGQ